MKYYAVTNDPTELMHYGIKGMKWGVIRTDAQLGHPSKPKKPRSAAYKKAESKLGKMMKSGIKKAEAHWQEHNSPENKAYRAYKKAEKRFEKHLQKAREGRLRYKGISDAEVARITDRLALERQSRSLSGAEKPKFIRRLGSAAGEGVLRGTSSYINARMEGRGRTTAEIKKAKRLARFEARDSTIRREAKREARENYYRQMAEDGRTIESMPMSVAKAAVRRTAGGLLTGIGVAYDSANGNEESARARIRNYKNETVNDLKYLTGRYTQRGRASYVRQRRLEDQRDARERKLQELRDNEYYKALGKRDAARDFGEEYVGNKGNKGNKKNTSLPSVKKSSSTPASFSNYSPSIKTERPSDSGRITRKPRPTTRRRTYYRPQDSGTPSSSVNYADFPPWADPRRMPKKR